MTADVTAPKRNTTPDGEAFNVRSGLTSITAIPKNEIKIPVMFSHESLSFRVKNATSGVKTGIVAIITALIVGEEFFNPKFSPIKYRKGLKSEDMRNSPRSSFFNFSNFPDK